MLNFFKRLFRLKRKVLMVDYENRIANYHTYDYPESGSLLLYKDNKTFFLPVTSIAKSGDVYNLQTPSGVYLLRYL